PVDADATYHDSTPGACWTKGLAASSTRQWFFAPANRVLAAAGSFGPDDSDSEAIDELAAEPSSDCHREPAGCRYGGRPDGRRGSRRICAYREAHEECEPRAAHHEHVSHGGVLCARRTRDGGEFQPSGENRHSARKITEGVSVE